MDALRVKPMLGRRAYARAKEIEKGKQMLLSQKRNIRHLLVLSFILFQIHAINAQENNIQENSAGFIKKYFVDQFGDPTDSMYLTKVCTGVFSNSATTNSELKVGIIISENEIGIGLFEYGNHIVKDNIPGIIIMMKSLDGSVYSQVGKLDPELGRIIIDNLNYMMDVSKIFNGVDIIKFLIYDPNRPVTKYNFSCILPSIEYINKSLEKNPVWLP